MKEKSLEIIEQYNKTLCQLRALEEAIKIMEKDINYKEFVKSLIELKKDKEKILKEVEKKFI